MAGVAGEGAVDWPDAPAFSYIGAAAPRAPLIVGVGMVAGGLLPLLIGAVGVLVLTLPEVVPAWVTSRSGPFGGIFAAGGKNNGSVIIFAAVTALGLFEIAFGLWFARRLTVLRPALAISADGVFAFRRGKPWRSLAWSDIVSIVKRCGRGAKTGQGLITVRIEAPGGGLELTSEIAGYDEACALLARHAQAHGITPLDQTGAAAAL
jgi:hypothetical protein